MSDDQPEALTSNDGQPTGEAVGGGHILGLFAMGISTVVLASDFSAMNVALPAIERELDSDISTIQWVINAYALVFGMAIVTGGRLADMFGRKKIFFTGATIFAVMAFLGGIAPGVPWLIGARALMGIGGAFMWPAILGMTFALLPKDKAGFAGGLIIGAAGVGQSIGPLLGGVLTELATWRWIQFINVPVAAFAILVTWRNIPRTVVEKPDQRIDYAGIVTLSIGILALLFALDQVPSWGWGDPRIIGSLALAAILFVAFSFIEPRQGPDALVPGDVVGNRQFTAVFAAIVPVGAAFFATLLYLPQFLQKLLEYSPLRAGLGMLPMMVPFAIVSFVAGSLYERFGAKLVVSSGAAFLTIGPFLLTFIRPDSGYTSLIAGMVAVGLGLGLFFSSATTAAVTSLDPDRSSLAGGLIYMSQIAGGAVGLGLVTMVVTSVAHAKFGVDVGQLGVTLTDAQLRDAHGILVGTESAQQALAGVGAQAATAARALVADAFAAGVRSGMILVTALSAVTFVISVLFVGGKRRDRDVPESAPGEPEAAP